MEEITGRDGVVHALASLMQLIPLSGMLCASN